MTRIFITVFLSLFLYSCVTISPEAEKVMVHSQVSNLLDDCKRLGNVSVTEDWTLLSRSETEQQAKNNLREQAFKKYGADTIAIINVDWYSSGVSIQGIAFNCDE